MITQWECIEGASSTVCTVTASTTEASATTTNQSLSGSEILFMYCVLLFFVSMFAWRYMFHPFNPQT